MQQAKNDQITELFHEDLTFPNVSASNWETLLSDLGGLAYKRGFVKDSFIPALLEREALYPTGLFTDVMKFAIPHADDGHVINPGVIVAKMAHPVQFQEMGTTDRTVEADYVFLLLVKKNGAQVTLLQRLIALCSDKETAKELDKAVTAGEIYRTIIDFFNQQRKEIEVLKKHHQFEKNQK